MSTAIQVRSQPFVKTAGIEQVVQRALRYLSSGYSIHLQGPTGIGKTTLAWHLADCRKRPMMLILGSHTLTITTQRDSWLRRACCEGWTLVYDEFNRSRPELNTVLLSTIEERILGLSHGYLSECVPIHPEFRVIFTSNSEEYCGTYSPQIALLDRLITIHLPEPNILAQQQLLVELVGVSTEAATLIVGIVQQFLKQVSPGYQFSLRPKLMIAEVCQREGMHISADDAEFRQVCRDVLLSRSSQSAMDANALLWELFNKVSKRLPAINTSASNTIKPYRSLEHVGY
ncbi:MAG: AAA domain-containing protein [Symploca sp. SIO2G7]|nr:AAA domain-containing protein [Symploca sp. SIO2G7]